MRLERRGTPTQHGGAPGFISVDANSNAIDGIRSIYDREIVGILLPGAYDKSDTSAISARLDSPTVDAAQPHDRATEYHVGKLLQWSRLGDEYFHAARRFDETCERLFEGCPSYAQVVEGALAKFSSGLPVRVAVSATGQSYSRSTIRLMGEAASLPLHFDKQQLPFEGYEELRSRIDLTTILSFFILLRLPEKGGDLVVYEREWTSADNRFDEMDWSSLKRAARDLPHAAVVMQEGDLVIFDAGRRLHEVTPVEGRRSRYTIGGFAAFARNGSALVYWA